MTVMKNLSLLNRSISSAWTSLAGKRSRIASYGRPPMAVGVVILTVLAWTLGHYTAPVHTQARTVAPTLDESEELAQTRHLLKAARRLIERYREELAAMDALQATESEDGK